MTVLTSMNGSGDARTVAQRTRAPQPKRQTSSPRRAVLFPGRAARGTRAAVASQPATTDQAWSAFNPADFQYRSFVVSAPCPVSRSAAAPTRPARGEGRRRQPRQTTTGAAAAVNTAVGLVNSHALPAANTA